MEKTEKEINEQVHSEKLAQTDQYINRISATLVTLFKLLEGIAAGFILYYLLFGSLREFNSDMKDMLQMILSNYPIFWFAIGDSLFSQFLVLLELAFILALIIVEAIALLSLRFAQKGAGVVSVIHRIYMLVCFLILACFFLLTLNNFFLLGETGFAVISYLIALLLLVLDLCYHKDIALAMETVKYEANTGRQGILQKTHLSEISFILGLPHVLSILFGLIMLIVARNQSASLSQNNEVTLQQCLLMFGLPAILFIKQLSICFCNRNLKRAR